MTTTEHLQKIKAKCQQLLDIAEERMPGKWIVDDDLLSGGIRASSDHVFLTENSYIERKDALFISSCAGPAEAGWRATISAISWLETSHVSVYKPEREEAERVTGEIIAAWPIELLD